MNTTEWRILLHELRTHAPTSCSVVIRRYPMKKNCGVTRFDGRKFQVRIDSGLSTVGQIDAILHEWAHVLAIEQGFLHKESWGSMFSKLYEIWAGNFATGVAL